ncbi:MAG: 3-hydroxyacyl-CoA dehydrogenase NAD-binding domain-containing protein [bacterium]|nr:3-hydroxyacyl-CoA dehydrogenase NAD-binding domain-containing protein [bacterium]
MSIAAVIGLGTMGAGIAAVLARSGMTVRGHDVNTGAIEATRLKLPAIAGVLDDLGVPARGPASDVSLTSSLEDAVADADLVIENVPEEVGLKRAVLAEIASLVSGNCVLASDTSGIPITRLQEGLPSPGRVVGMHWSNPPHIIPVVEVVAGDETSADTVEWMVATVRRLNLIPVRVKCDVPGFVENRILYAVMREALDLVERGVVDAEDLDTCVSWGIGYKLAVVGPMSLLDMAGLDIYGSVAGYLNRDLCSRSDVSPWAAEKIAAGRLGLKTGEGIYAYDEGEAASLGAARARRLVAVRRALEEAGEGKS